MPTRTEVEAKFQGLVEGAISRDDADRWAAQWVAADADVEDDAIWWGLMTLIGVDLRHGPELPYLYNLDQIAGWLEEFRARCAQSEPA